MARNSLQHWVRGSYDGRPTFPLFWVMMLREMERLIDEYRY
jgi:hypothetical protein